MPFMGFSHFANVWNFPSVSGSSKPMCGRRDLWETERTSGFWWMKTCSKKKSISIFLISDKIYKHKRAPLRGCDISLSFYFNRVNGGRLDINGGFFCNVSATLASVLHYPSFILLTQNVDHFQKKKSRLPRSLYAHTSYFLDHCFCFVHPPNII